MKKATTKRERKYGKKSEDGTIEKKPVKPRKKVRLIVDGYSILEFKTRKEAEAYIESKNAQADEKRQHRASFVFM